MGFHVFETCASADQLISVSKVNQSRSNRIYLPIMSRADDKVSGHIWIHIPHMLIPPQAASDDGFTNFTDAVDLQTFSQILEMDEPGDNEFSQSIVFGFFDQAEETFEQMNDAL